VLFATLTPLLDEHSGEMRIPNPLRPGEDRVQGHYGGRDVLLSVREPVRGTESSLFRIVLGSRTTMPFVFSVQKRMLLGIVSNPQVGRLVRTGDKGLDKRYRITDLTVLTRFGIFQRLFGSSKKSKDLQENLDKRLISWLRLPETLRKLDILFRSCGVDYLSTQAEYPARIELSTSQSGLTAILRHYSKGQLLPDNVRCILEEMDSLLRSAESLLELKAEQRNSSG